MSTEGASAMGEDSKEKSALVPRRRFPEFRDDGEWEQKKLGEVINLEYGSSLSENNRNGGAIPVVGSNGIVGYHDEYLVTGPAIVIGRKGSVGEVNWIDRDCYPIDTTYFVNNKKPKSYLLPFLNVLLQRSDLSRLKDPSAVPGLNRDSVHSLISCIPKPAEQQKIADCLSSLDDLITAETQKLDALKTHKKGLMQQLFPREGEAMPRLRFPEFQEAGEWEEKLIEDFFDVGSSKRVLQEDWTTQGVPFYRTRELVSLSKNEPFGSEIFISEALFREITEKYGLPAEGDFLVSGVGTLGISYQVQAQDRFYFKDGNVLWFKLRGGIVSTFFKYCFEADEIQNQILAQASISTVGTYTIQNAKVTKFSCPTNIEEQQEIADCLSSIDGIITAQSQRIDDLKTHKKGLMQQLFPVLDEVQA